MHTYYTNRIWKPRSFPNLGPTSIIRSWCCSVKQLETCNKNWIAPRNVTRHTAGRPLRSLKDDISQLALPFIYCWLLWFSISFSNGSLITFSSFRRCCCLFMMMFHIQGQSCTRLFWLEKKYPIFIWTCLSSDRSGTRNSGIGFEYTV